MSLRINMVHGTPGLIEPRILSELVNSISKGSEGIFSSFTIYQGGTVSTPYNIYSSKFNKIVTLSFPEMSLTLTSTGLINSYALPTNLLPDGEYTFPVFLSTSSTFTPAYVKLVQQSSTQSYLQFTTIPLVNWVVGTNIIQPFTITYTSPDYTTIPTTPISWGTALDISAPVAVSYIPALSAAYTGTMSITFNEPIQKHTSGLVTVKVYGGSIVESFDITDSKCTISGSTLTITTTSPLPDGFLYTILIASGAVKDSNNNLFVGISSENTWKFSVGELALVPGTYTLKSTLGNGSNNPASIKSFNSQVYIATRGGNDLYRSSDNSATWNTTSSAFTSSIGTCYDIFDVTYDGTKIFNVASTGQLGGIKFYSSSNGGVSFTANTVSAPSASSNSWSSICCSNDGTKLLATQDPGFPFLSNDSGTSWNVVNSAVLSYNCSSSTMSYSGSRIYLQSNAPELHRSVDGGTVWLTPIAVTSFIDVVCNRSTDILVDGKYVLLTRNGIPSLSTDFGGTFNPITGVPSGIWSRADISYSGRNMVIGNSASNATHNVYKSTNFGVNWSLESLSGLGISQVFGVAITGSKITCRASNGYIYSN